MAEGHQEVRIKVLIRSVTANGFGPRRTVVHGRNGTGKSVLFRAMRARLKVVRDMGAWPGWLAASTDPREAWSDVGRVLVEVESREESTCTFLDDDEIVRLLYRGVDPWREGDDWIDELDISFCQHLSRMVGDDLERRNAVPGLEWCDPGVVLAGLENAPTGLKTMTALALALALRDVRSPDGPLVIDDGGLGMLDQQYRRRVVRELAILEGQVILFTGVDDVAERLGTDYIVAPVRYARGMRVRRYTSSRQRPVV